MADTVNFTQLPHDDEAEQSLIGSMLINPACIAEVVGQVSADDFYSETNRSIFETIFSMFSFSMTIDSVTMLNRMRSEGTYTDELRDYVFQVVDLTPAPENALLYAKIIRDYALLRKIALAGTEINTLAMSAQGKADDILDLTEQKIYAIRQGRATGGLREVSKVMVDVYRALEEAAKSGQSIPGLSTGFPDLDNMIMGLNKSDLILVAARPGMGKTTLALNITLNVARASGKAVAVFSLEMSREQLCMSLLSTESQVNRKKLQSGLFSPEEMNRIVASSVSLGGMNILMDDNPMLTVAEINAACRRVQNLGLVVIDYLQLMTSAGGPPKYGENRTTIVSDISRMLKIMAKELNVPVICASQLNRATESRGDKKPQLSDLRESGAIEQDADIILALYRDDYYNKNSERPNIVEVNVLKNRRGETGTVELRWTPEYASFSSLDRRHEEF